jgi:hypothetical protein
VALDAEVIPLIPPPLTPGSRNWTAVMMDLVELSSRSSAIKGGFEVEQEPRTNIKQEEIITNKRYFLL